MRVDADTSAIKGGAAQLLTALIAQAGSATSDLLAILSEHRVAPAAVDELVAAARPELARERAWRDAVAQNHDRARRQSRALQLLARALDPLGAPVALAPSGLGPLWARDIDLLVPARSQRDICQALLNAGCIDVGALESPSRAKDCRSLAAVEDGIFLAPVDLTRRLYPGGPDAEEPVRRAVRGEPGMIPLLAPRDRLGRRVNRVVSSRRIVVRDALEFLAVLEECGGASHERTVRIALHRCAELERALGVQGGMSGAAAGLRRPHDLTWVLARARGAQRRLTRSRRHAAVAFSGIDGAGKSTQARMLVTSLNELGVPATAVWARLGYSGSGVIARAARLGQRLLPAGSHSAQTARSAGVAAPSAPPLTRRGVVGATWALAVTVDYLLGARRAARQARGTVVVFDRGLPDALVALDEEFGGALELSLHRRLIRRWLPPADATFYLRLPGRTALARKEDSFVESVLDAHASRYDEVVASLGPHVITIDARQAPEDVATEVMRRLVASSQDGASSDRWRAAVGGWLRGGRGRA